MFNILSNIKELALIASLLVGIGATTGFFKRGQEIDRLNNNLYAKTVQWEDEKGRLVTETTELRFTVEELQSIASRDSAKLNETEKKLWEVAKEAEALRVDKDKLVSYHKAEMEAVHENLEVVPTIKDNKIVSIKPIDTKHLKVNFKVVDGAVLADAKYSANITTIVDRQRDKYTRKGNKRFFIARWVKPRWQYSDKTVSDDPNASIINSVSINFDNRK